MDCRWGYDRVDAHGAALAPGLLTSHCCIRWWVISRRGQQQTCWIDSTLHGGSRRSFQPREVLCRAAPKGYRLPQGMATCVCSAVYRKFRPLLLKVHAGAPVMKHCHGRKSLPRWPRHGVTLLGESVWAPCKECKNGGRRVVGCCAQIRDASTPTLAAPHPRIRVDRRRIWCSRRGQMSWATSMRTLRPARRTRSSVCAKGAKAALEIVHNENERAALLR